MLWETKQVLVSVKAYPTPSKKYGETVCVAGIDIKTGKWIRLYPVLYRDLDDEQKFKKYSVIEVQTTKAQDDHRPESFKIAHNTSIKKIDWYDTKNFWEERKKMLLPTVSKSFCEILEERKLNNKSLGMFKPRKVKFHYKKARPKNEEAQKACYAQLSFYNKDKDAIEAIPFSFEYSFNCHEEPNCPGHKLPIIDWEIAQSYRNWRWKYKNEDVLLEKIEQRWLDGMCSEKHDTYFFVGNWKQFRDNFMILGVFYPKKRANQ